jgi:hypothetical protein
MRSRKIIDHRKRRGIVEYFVKWRDFAESECSWVKETDFDTVEIIEDYWDRLTEETPTPTALIVSQAIKERETVRRTTMSMQTSLFLFNLFAIFCIGNAQYQPFTTKQSAKPTITSTSRRPVDLSN